MYKFTLHIKLKQLSTLTSINFYAFGNYYILSLVLSESLTTIDSSGFRLCTIGTLVYPSKYYGAYPFTLNVYSQIFRGISVKPGMELFAYISVSVAYPFILSPVLVSFVLVNLCKTAQSWQEQQRI